VAVINSAQYGRRLCCDYGKGVPVKAKNFKLKEQFAIGLSVAAFALSLVSFYVTGLRVTDDLRVVAGEMPLVGPDFQKKQFTIQEIESRFTFINAGTRSAVIAAITLSVAQPEEKEGLPDSGCRMSRVRMFQYDTKPFVLKPGEMLAKDAVVIAIATVPFSELNAKSEKISFKMCVDVSFTTPSVEYNVVTINEFEDELDETVGGYVTFGSDKVIERRPVQLTKRSGIILFD
jgi:hypothetical protein